MKTLLRQLIKVGAIPWSIVSQTRCGGIYFLIYHKIGGGLPLDVDLPAPLFRRQLDFLAQSGRVVSYERALALLQQGRPLTQNLFVLTFDDGYEDFYTQVFPLLQAFQLPAILFVTTGFVEERITYPLAQVQLEARPVTWDMLGHMHQSGLITLGAHTHTHPNLVKVSTRQVNDELTRPIQLFQTRLGLPLKHFAYPRALWDERTEILIKQHYSSAVIGEGKKATADQCTPYRIPRVPVRVSDGWFFFRAKLRGLLEAEVKLYALLHQFQAKTHKVL